jgi:3-phenylpropionate/cinnamic acid dioxygenase small subunit
MTTRLEAHELIARYGNCLDRGEFDELEALFADDAEFHIDPDPGVGSPLVGARRIRESVEERWRLVHASEQRRHVMSNVEVTELSDTAARVRTTLVVLAASGSEVRLHGVGAYDDRLERRADRWVFAERRLTVDRRDYFAPGWVSAT